MENEEVVLVLYDSSRPYAYSGNRVDDGDGGIDEGVIVEGVRSPGNEKHIIYALAEIHLNELDVTNQKQINLRFLRAYRNPRTSFDPLSLERCARISR